MTADLEQWRDKEKMYPEDWEQVIAATNSSSSALFKSDTVFQEGWKLRLSYRAFLSRHHKDTFPLSIIIDIAKKSYRV
jgi:hypothetical protein